MSEAVTPVTQRTAYAAGQRGSFLQRALGAVAFLVHTASRAMFILTQFPAGERGPLLGTYLRLKWHHFLQKLWPSFKYPQEKLFGRPFALADHLSLVGMFECMFLEREYEFRATTDRPRIIDCGSNVGLSLLSFKRRYPRSRIVELENTHNMGGGSIWPVAQLQAVCDITHRYGLVTHLDGARLLNAVVATDIPARTYAAPFDSVWIDLSKGLGCPVGAVLAGSREFIKEARRLKQLFGGAMRQAGIIAAAGVYALQHHVDRLAEDHEHAKMLARALAELPQVALHPVDVETNIVIFDVTATALPAQAIAERLETAGVRVSVVGRTKLRAVTHLDVSRQDVERAIAVFRRVLG